MTSPHTTGIWITADSATILRWSPEQIGRAHV